MTLLVSTIFVMYYYHYALVSHPTKINMYTALENENSVSRLTIIVNKRKLIEPYGGRNRKQHSSQPSTLNNRDE
jgi:hypothetical protein